jgi:magnesium transporter
MAANRRTAYTVRTLAAELGDTRTLSSAALAERFLELPQQERSRLITELPETYRRSLLGRLRAPELAGFVNRMRTDDATDLMILLKQVDEAKWLDTIALMEPKLTAAVKALMDYTEEEAGSLMEIELFTVSAVETVGSSLKRLRGLIGEHVTNIYLVDNEHRLQAIFPLSRIATAAHPLTYRELCDESLLPLSVHSRSSLHEAARLMKRYNLSVLPVINRNSRLLGRITHDDMLDYLQEDATKQIYGLGQVNPQEEIEAGLLETGRDRAFWLLINLLNASLLSLVIGLFEHSLQQVVALAVLMPIVANTVTVRQMALGSIGWEDAAPTLYREFRIALLNGALFAVLAAGIAYFRFSSLYIGGAIAAAMLVSFLAAGVLGAAVPLWLKVLRIDPAVASSIIVMALVDVIGFFSFLGFATLWIPAINTQG